MLAISTSMQAYVPMLTPRASIPMMCDIPPVTEPPPKAAAEKKEKGWRGLGFWEPFETRATSLAADPDSPFSGEISDKAGLTVLAKQLNPVVGYWDPLNVASDAPYMEGGEAGSAETIAWFRHAEIKHCRVAMAAFVGFIVQSNGIHFPWDIQNGLVGGFGDGSTISFAQISDAGGPAAQWDALPTAAKTQIIAAIGFLELWGESSVAFERSGTKHYIKGGKPGFYPPFNVGKESIVAPHPVPLNLFDPFGFSKNKTPAQKAKGLLAEINNGRLAQIGIIAFVAESRVPGSVPLLQGKIAPYSGEVMAPFSSNDIDLPFVENMLSYAEKFLQFGPK